MTVSYIWSRGLHLTVRPGHQHRRAGSAVTYRINDASGNQTGTYSTPVYVRQNRVDPRYARINIVDAGLNSWYNGLAVQLNKRMSHGVTGSVAYTWSHAIDEGQGRRRHAEHLRQRRSAELSARRLPREKGTSALDVRHRLVVSGVWQPTSRRAPARSRGTW